MNEKCKRSKQMCIDNNEQRPSHLQSFINLNIRIKSNEVKLKKKKETSIVYLVYSECIFF